MDLINSFDVSVPIDQAWAVLTDVERIAPCLPGAQLQEIEGDEYRGIVKVKVGPITAQYKGKATFTELDAVAYRAVLEGTGRDTRGQGNANATITAELTPAGGGTHVVVTTDLTVTGKVAQFGRGVLADVSAKLLNQFVDNLETTVLVDLADTAEVAEVGQVVEVVEAGAFVDAVVAAEVENVAAAVDVATEMVAEAVEEAAELVEEAVEEAVETVELAMAETGDGLNGQQAAIAEAKVADAVRRIDSPEPEAIDLLEHAGSSVLKRVLPLVGVALAVFIVWRLVRRRR